MMITTYLNATRTSGQGVGDTVSDELTINVNVVLAGRKPQCGHVDGHVQDPEEGQGEHGGHRLG